MAAFVKYEILSENIAKKVHAFHAAGDTLNVMLSNTAPVVGTDQIRSGASEIAGGNGYTSGGADTQNDTSRTGGTTSVTGVDIVWTASGGSIATFRYAILFDDTPTSPVDPLIGYWDYGSSIAPATGETFTVDFGTSMFTIA